MPGTRLGPYEVVATIGAGGMGEVYRARDAKLNRDVALKILPPAFIADPDRLARFRREAQVLASLNHPNIAAIYGFEDSGATHALVLELVEGPTLADRIAEGPMPVPDAILIARQIAEALDAAHQQGIIHRDLKPANIKVRDDGTVKVLDFGLAKAMDPLGASTNAANSPTLTTNATAMGTIIGTAAYMSPEQARGRTVDKRADIWAFGAVLYELITGHAAFPGDNTTDILAAVVTLDPDWNAVPAATPAPVRRLLKRCLDKDLKRRLRDIGDAQLELASDESSGTAARIERRRSQWWYAAPWMLALVLAVALGVLLARPSDRTADIG
ncbi:MAG: serine/threonine-protein kinase, partial [Vicinamibacterales bacterium]